MSGIGKGAAPVIPAAATTGAVTATTLPVTGPNTILEVAMIAAAGLAIWTVVYVGITKLQRS